MNAYIKKRLIRTGILCTAGLSIGAAVGFFQIQMENAQIAQISPAAGIATGEAQVGGPFSLIDHTGKTVSEADYPGYKLIYFGFTYCPAICPTELQKISRALNILQKDKPEIAANLHPLFITIDPERDTVDVMRDYVDLFHPGLVGLTGSIEQIETVKKSYRVYASKVQDEANNDYTMDHSSFIYLMGPDNNLITMYKIDESANFMVEDIKLRLSQS